MSKNRSYRSQNPISPGLVVFLAVFTLALGMLAPTAGAEDARREYEKQLAGAAKEYPLVVAALLHAQEDVQRMANFAATLDAEALRESRAQIEVCRFTCRFRPGQHCWACEEPADDEFDFVRIVTLETFASS